MTLDGILCVCAWPYCQMSECLPRLLGWRQLFVRGGGSSTDGPGGSGVDVQLVARCCERSIGVSCRRAMGLGPHSVVAG
jgi:hypothetical protein